MFYPFFAAEKDFLCFGMIAGVTFRFRAKGLLGK